MIARRVCDPFTGTMTNIVSSCHSNAALALTSNCERASRGPLRSARAFLGHLAAGLMTLPLLACGGADQQADSAEVSASKSELTTSSCVGQTTIPEGVKYTPCPALPDAQCTAANGCGWQEYQFSNCGTQASGPYTVPVPPNLGPGNGPPTQQEGPQAGYCYKYSYRLCTGSGGAYVLSASTSIDCSTFAASECSQHSGCSLVTPPASTPGYCGRTSVQNCERAVGATCCALDHTLYLCTDSGWASRAPC